MRTSAIISATVIRSGISFTADRRRLRLTLLGEPAPLGPAGQRPAAVRRPGPGRQPGVGPVARTTPAVTHGRRPASGPPPVRARRRRSRSSEVQRPTGQPIQSARPITLSTGTMPPPGSPRWSRESRELLRWSPMTHSVPCGTTMSKGTSGRGVAGMQISLVHGYAVHLDPAPLVAADHPVTADADHALDEVGLGGLGEPERREHAARQRALTGFSSRPSCTKDPVPSKTTTSPRSRLGAETVRQLVHQHPVPDLQGGLHGAAGDQEGLHHEVAEQQHERRCRRTPSSPARARTSRRAVRASAPERRENARARPLSLPRFGGGRAVALRVLSLRCPSGAEPIRPPCDAVRRSSRECEPELSCRASP